MILLRASAGNNFLPREGYLLEAGSNRLELTASGKEGIFRGLQTVLQLMENGTSIPACRIEDAPAFSWRAFMVDVGRNFQSLPQLKEQIDVMAAYKLNVFHIHLTEDLAWRWQMKSFPQLTDAKNMERAPGKFYTREDLLELERYCKERFITMVPEIDIPGHSAAFRRALGTDMQSDTGIHYLKTILREVAKDYPFHWLHLGGDEVKVRDRNYMKSLVAYAEELGFKTLAWDPGAELNNSTVRQLWMREGVKDKKGQYIDSRHLYLNHMDPLESVSTIFNRRMGGRLKGDSSLLGATLCIWHDRNINEEKDLLRMNPVYPGMLAFSERTWRGGGEPGWVTNIVQDPDSFKLFEDRLMEHKKNYFSEKPFPYSKSELVWSFLGPYPNEGMTDKRYAPELDPPIVQLLKPVFRTRGGTLILRHWWDPAVQGLLKDPKENTTWYAYTNYYSEASDTVDCWIGFNNISRSMASKPPATGTWDNKNSKLWVNGSVIEPPVWKTVNGTVNLEKPLTDEGYEYRSPSRIPLKKGSNLILVKLPVGSFTGENWNNPVKWMFSFVIL